TGAGEPRPYRPGSQAGEPRISVCEPQQLPHSTKLFYVRTHFAIVNGVDVRTWRLKIEGQVERPLELSYADLLKMPSRTQIAMLECAGNGRSFLVPKAEGVPWGLGGVSNAEWTGVPLAAVLDRAG